MTKGCMIAGMASGCGKTTVATGIMAALRKLGFAVAPFKAGPDYIDTGFHGETAGRPSINLDIWLCGEENVRYLYHRYSEGCDAAIIEGVMGLYDGMGYKDSFCSSAHIAKALGIPVILVLDGQGLSMSAAAIAKGFKDFDENVHIAGIIFNRVCSQEHYLLLKRIIEEKTGMHCIGRLPEEEVFFLPERHLGLVPACETESIDARLEKLAAAVQKYIDLDLLLKLCAQVKRRNMPAGMGKFLAEHKNSFSGKTVAVAMDEAFHFYYQPNIDLLQMLGAEIVHFSPLHSKKLPDADALYIGGGFPEVFAEELEANRLLRKDLREKLEAGLKCYAECGGLMYLCDHVADKQGRLHEMAGVIPADAAMTDDLQRFGYAAVKTESGLEMHAHEFHFSELIEREPLDYMFAVKKPDGSDKWPCGIRRKNTVAGYPHLHFWANPKAVLELFI